jgi:DNA-binding HxlR family transcriptional regulator
MPGKRSYDDACGVARALRVVGERWTLLVVRELLLGPKRFTDLSRGLPGMSQNVLSQRLRELEEAGIVRRTRLGAAGEHQRVRADRAGRGAGTGTGRAGPVGQPRPARRRRGADH